MARIGYARVSTMDQNLARQIQDLENPQKGNVDKIFTDKESGKNMNRAGWNELSAYIRDGDTLVIKSLDRLSRNYDDIQQTWSTLLNKGVGVEVLNQPVVNVASNRANSLTSKLFISLWGFIAENERNKIRERQSQGIVIAKKNGVYKGRKPAYSAESTDVGKRMIYEKILEMREPVLRHEVSINSIASRFGVSRNTVHRILNPGKIHFQKRDQ